MGGPFEAVKQFVSLEQQKPMQPLANAEQAFMSDQVAPSTIEPSSNPVTANTMKTELQPSALATLPVKLPAMGAVRGSNDISLIGDAEAGASLTEIVPMSSNMGTSAAATTTS